MIGIVYRDDGQGKGIFYDHYTFQHATHQSTCALKVSSQDSKLIINAQNYLKKPLNYSEGIRKLMMDYLDRNENLKLEFVEKKNGRGLPMISDFSMNLKEIDKEIGLLVIVGHLKVIENDPSTLFRFEFERNVIRKALLIGQPILCICSGCWRLYEALGGSVSNINTEVRHASGMINLDSDGKIQHQGNGHGIILQSNNQLFNSQQQGPSDREDLIPECTILKASMFGKYSNSTIVDENEPINVNSVHWLAPQLVENSSIIDISALSIPDYSIEGFEMKYGSPVMGIQWHPEAYILNNEQKCQQNILQYMAKAGDTFLLKRKVLEEIRNMK